MRQLFYLLLCSLLFALSCDKTADYEYAVVCDFPYPAFGDTRLLVVTSQDGEVLKEFDLPYGATSLNERFSVAQKASSDLLNLHFIRADGLPNVDYAQIWSHYGVRNGQAIDLRDRSNTMPKRPVQRRIKLVIKDVAVLDDIQLIDCEYVKVWNSPDWSALVSLRNGQGIFILRQGGQNGFYLPGANLPDSVTISSLQFAPIQKKLTAYASQSSTDQILVRAVSPDLQQYVSLGKQVASNNATATFLLPNGLDPNWRFHVSSHDHEFAMEKTFPLGESLNLGLLELKLFNKKPPAEQGILVECKGPAEWVSVYSLVQKSGEELSWTVMGRSSDFENWQIPSAVQKYLPGIAGKEIFKTYTARAFHCPEFGYDGMARGFPWKSPDLFAASRQGYEMVQR